MHPGHRSPADRQSPAWPPHSPDPLCPPQDSVTHCCLGWLRHRATLQRGQPWVPVWHHPAGPNASSLGCWAHRSAGAAPSLLALWIQSLGEPRERHGGGAGSAPSTPAAAVAAGTEGTRKQQRRSVQRRPRRYRRDSGCADGARLVAAAERPRHRPAPDLECFRAPPSLPPPPRFSPAFCSFTLHKAAPAQTRARPRLRPGPAGAAAPGRADPGEHPVVPVPVCSPGSTLPGSAVASVPSEPA